MSQSNFDFSKLTTDQIKRLAITPGNLYFIYKQNINNFEDFLKLLEIKEETKINFRLYMQHQQEIENKKNESISREIREEKEESRRAAIDLSSKMQQDLLHLQRLIQIEIQQANMDKALKFYDTKIDSYKYEIKNEETKLVTYKEDVKAAEETIKQGFTQVEQNIPKLEANHNETTREMYNLLDALKQIENDEVEDIDEGLKKAKDKKDVVPTNLPNPIESFSEGAKEKDVQKLDNGLNMTINAIIAASAMARRFKVKGFEGGKKAKEIQTKYENQYNTVDESVKTIKKGQENLTEAKNNITLTENTIAELKSNLQILEEDKKKLLLNNQSSNRPSGPG